MDARVVAAWEAEYRAGRYANDPPDPMVEPILREARARGFLGGPALEVGCGNGRNYRALVAGGLDVVGLDVAPTALAQLAARSPERRDRLVLGDLTALPEHARYPVVIGIQVFQHGDRRTSHSHVRRAQRRVGPGGLFALRVNATGTELEYAHAVLERGSDGGFTAEYLEGPKAGLQIRFFGRRELARLFARGFTEVVPPHAVATERAPPARGRWLQWEAIWVRTGRGRRRTAPPSRARRARRGRGRRTRGGRGSVAAERRRATPRPPERRARGRNASAVRAPARTDVGTGRSRAGRRPRAGRRTPGDGRPGPGRRAVAERVPRSRDRRSGPPGPIGATPRVARPLGRVERPGPPRRARSAPSPRRT